MTIWLPLVFFLFHIYVQMKKIVKKKKNEYVKVVCAEVVVMTNSSSLYFPSFGFLVVMLSVGMMDHPMSLLLSLDLSTYIWHLCRRICIGGLNQHKRE